MKLLFLFAIMSIPLSYAEIIQDRIHSIEKIPGTSKSIIKFEKGRVAFVNDDVEIVHGHFVKAKVDKKYNLKSIEAARIEESPRLLMLEPQGDQYTPSVLTRNELNDFWNTLKVDYTRKSECSDRAFIWAFEGWKKKNYQVEMVFALFTASYINRHRFKWWFHVAPLITVKEGDSVEKYVLDHQFVDRPVKIKEWTDLMVFSKRECKMTDRFSEYDVNPQTEDCYMMIDSMYNRIPASLSDKETKGIVRTEFNASEVRMSYRLSFKTGADSL